MRCNLAVVGTVSPVVNVAVTITDDGIGGEDATIGERNQIRQPAGVEVLRESRLCRLDFLIA